VKPRRFRSLGERRSITAFFLFTCVCVGALLSPRTAFAEKMEDLKKLRENCAKESTETLSIYADKSREKLVEDYDPSLQCKVNAGEEPIALSHNARSVHKDIWRNAQLFNPLNRNETEARRLGACRIAYLSMKEIFNYFQKANASYCKALKISLDNAIDCGDVSEKCQQQYQELNQVFSKYKNGAKQALGKAEKYLNTAKKASEDAKKKYEEDLKTLEIEWQKNANITATAGKPAIPIKEADSILGRPDLKPSNANASTKNFREYYALLAGMEEFIPRTQVQREGGKIILEHKDAVSQINEFSEKLNKQIEQSISVAATAAENVQSMLANIEKSGSNDSGIISGLNKHATTATAAAGLGKQLVPGDKTPALTGGSVAPSLTALAAAGAAGAALRNSFGSSSSSDPGSINSPSIPQAAATPLVAPVTASLENSDVFGKDKTSSNELPDPLNKTDPTANIGTAEVGGNYPAFGASEGSSRMLANGNKKAARAAAPAEGKVGDANPEDALQSFGGGMTPKPAPKAKQMSAGAEVANLLGQMKNLFNFDEGAPMGEASPMGGSHTPTDPGGAIPGSAGEEVAEDEAAPSDSNSEQAMEENPYIEEKTVQAAQFGRSDTSLFSRVHKRHTRCMEKGLVLYQLGERVE